MLCSIKHVAVHRLGFLGGDDHAGLQAGESDPAVLVGLIDAVVGADGGAAAVGDQELHAGQRLVRGSRHQLLDDQILGGLVGKGDGLGVVGVDLHGLRLGVGINDVARNCLDLLHDHSPHDAQDLDLPGGIGGIDAVERTLFGKEIE